MNEENQVYFVDSDELPAAALERKHKLEQDPSSRTNHMEYMAGMQVIESDIKDKVLAAMDSFDYDSYTAEDVQREPCPIPPVALRILRPSYPLPLGLFWSRWQERQRS